ncbi:hypothetical protein BUALT_Bualt08G0006700 [Buddleja alternifolia]|uniref:PPM-type phosphatase domain-containing protein n=1 Tax=Buddleja alternifolia TaxID=168488 RepID=A0AAV6XDH7_9LAMI|nr:hypothetical protein BUALT_Bualt08G0006700 [Buddleja alternifolia]
MEKHKIFIILVLGLLFCATSCSCSCSESSPSLTVSPDLVQRFINTYQSNKSLDELPTNCQFSTSKGRRRYQEDRFLCDLDLKILFHGFQKGKLIKLGLVAVFDGHIGEEASDMVSKIFLPKFRINILNSNHPKYYNPLNNLIEPDTSNFNIIEEINYMEVLKESLVSTIMDVDVEFSKEAVTKDLYSGTTAVVALLVDDHILVANVGDSKALLCSVNHENEGGLLHQQLTRDHNALIHEERSRIEAAGGHIFDWKVPLVMGHFPMTRAIGDVPLKRYGIIAEPEVTGWKAVSANDSFLVVASDGIFESLTPKDVCNLLAGDDGGDKTAADFIVQRAYEKGSSDNLSVVVVPLR